MNIRRLLEEAAEAVFPSNIYCIVCGSLIDRSRPYALCDDCVQKIHWITDRSCARCGKALPETYNGAATAEGGHLCYDCMAREHYFTRGFSCMTYGLHEREIMMDIKYHNKGYMAYKMGDVLFDKMEGLILEAAARGIAPFDIVVPVPVSEKRLAKRGYNQSELMARQFLKRWKESAGSAGAAGLNERAGAVGIANRPAAAVPKLDTGVLYRRKETVMLRSLNPSERRMVLADAFAVRAGAEGRIKGKSLLLIDDIYTTGATADACSKVLLEAGAGAVYLLTLCSGGNRAPEGSEEDAGPNVE